VDTFVKIILLKRDSIIIFDCNDSTIVTIYA